MKLLRNEVLKGFEYLIPFPEYDLLACGYARFLVEKPNWKSTDSDWDYYGSQELETFYLQDLRRVYEEGKDIQIQEDEMTTKEVQLLLEKFNNEDL